MVKDKTNSQNSLAETKAGVEWLKQFDAEDIETAHLLLDSLVFISNKELVDGIKRCIDAFLDTHEGKVAIYVAREVPKNVKDYWKIQEENRIERVLKRQLEETAGIRPPSNSKTKKTIIDKAPTYFKNKVSRPNPIGSSKKGIGSEGTFAHLCRDICAGNNRLLDHPSLSGIKRSICSWLLCIDDIIGSGKRMEEFVRWLNMHKTIKSKRSFRWIKFAAISYAVSEIGLARIENFKILESIGYSTYVPAGRTFWADLQRNKIIEFCKKYGQQTSKSWFACGFKNSMTFTVFEHKCPNTAPAILWAPASKNKKYKGLFDNRPGIILEKWPNSNKDRNQDRILKSLRQTRLCKPSFFSHLNVESRQLLVLLAALAVKKRKTEILSDMLELSQDSIISMISKCKDYGWISNKLYLTDAGYNTLKAARRNLCLPGMDINLNNDFYYPKFLRNSASSFSSGSPEKELP